MNEANFKVGDRVKVITRDLKDAKIAKSPFEGIVIVKKGQGENKTFTVRKIAVGRIAVEKIFSLNSPAIERVQVIKKGGVRRAKLYYLRKKI
ncbi:hypothetical protein A2697_05520 [Candidatus Curtissbacteria bacterium RIFCSPHIGHO2_01_FULL_41_44]|uniref:50S ribosomal protein L19 n=1 Tax=Candidatus Curtissbacteria bacterium RIFCSPLOWO2_01_FULL_42_50 TaxID=1797730 RepID=A0A1F5H4H1_9BACT|nr:MAG: hypothetical protein A2697_05520 [Candidatus Curtissbacteria bacterium RIFCSPHIGHO2_01_FULL_41_44]OGD93265.1 MAG: hypothetical protein A3C33_04490 [Candidatus Curtissbacteria bacterium RIFCSPHIGHO2_02_FULL_42_58]OGD96905.1 MAG: hypothetical protein A3E71_00500 [Candidatus Curtissbacteria bacterium RIFCSPHIGHO2_12_FULL_42_33]OGD98969.1 MAG: hypothetical protein A3B54_01320 [Candidatus Curtissbacteria bacterium RIFCSPLOWO2_01_FULL_42_50]OGE03513.1 MAG: hypothetical protein A3G16_02880 [Ca